jgi:hypothetical protein
MMTMKRTTILQEAKQAKAAIKEGNYSIIRSASGVTYTVGLTKLGKQPEVMVEGLPPARAVRILKRAALIASRGVPLQGGLFDRHFQLFKAKAAQRRRCSVIKAAFGSKFELMVARAHKKPLSGRKGWSVDLVIHS